ncbi:serine hydrolase [Candidatus Microgenomates bacterium]|nr:MAG: serine hydrolase [Candidatus Microgenomates bacterium]
MRSLFTILAFIFIILLIGRNLSFLPKFNLAFNNQNETEEIRNKVKKIIAKQKGSYSVYYADLKNPNSSFGIDEKQMHTGASINKLPIVAVLYFLDNKKETDLDEKIILQKEDIQDYGTGSLRYQKPGGSYSLRTLAKLSLKQSDNTASYIIATKIGVGKIQKIINEWGLSQTDMADNKTTVLDEQVLLKKIYEGKITNKANTQELLGFIKDTDIEDRIPLLLDKKTVVFHKTGDAIGNIHDVGIIEKDGISFYLGVMTSDIGDKENETKKVIAEIAKTILDYKENRKY